MNKNTFGNSDKYKMLIFLTEGINQLDLNKKQYLSNFIHHFNKIVNSLQNAKHRDYLVKLIKNDYNKRIDEMIIDLKLKSYMKNYINAKINNNE